MRRTRVAGVAVAVGVVAAALGAGAAAAPKAAAAVFPHLTAYLGVFCTKDPASAVRGQVYDYDQRRHVLATIRDFRGRVGSLRLAFTTAVVRMTTGVPVDSEIKEVDDAATARAFRGWLGHGLLLEDGSPDPRAIEAAFDRAKSFIGCDFTFLNVLS
jgi:hypothetical protein